MEEKHVENLSLVSSIILNSSIIKAQEKMVFL